MCDYRQVRWRRLRKGSTRTSRGPDDGLLCI
jgi:hypothetical protein